MLPMDNICRALFVYLMSVTLYWKACFSEQHLEMISILPMNVPVGPALTYSGSALRMSVETANERFKGSLNISLKLLYNAQYRTCDDTAANTAWMFAEHMLRHWDEKVRTNECSAVVAVGCAGFINPAYLAKEWNVPIFSTGIMQQTEVNPYEFPSAIALSGTYEGFATVFMQIFRMNRWYHVTALLDTTATNVIYVNTANALLRLAKADPPRNFQIQTVQFNASRPDSVAPALEVARKRSRIIILFCHAKVGINVLKAADSFKMLNNDYAYLMLQPSQVDIYGKIDLFSGQPESSLRLFKNLIYLTTHHSEGYLVDDLNQRIASRTKAEYNTIFTPEAPPLDLYGTKGAYDAVSLWAAAVNRSATCSGDLLAEEIRDHIFHLDTGVTLIRSDGTRLLDMDVYVYNTTERALKVIMWYDSSMDKLIWIDHQYPSLENITNPLINPVRDIPVCGFLESTDNCSHGTLDTTTVVVSAVVVIFLSMTVSLAAIKLIVRQKAEKWWLIQEEYNAQRILTYANPPDSFKAEFRGNPVWIQTYPCNYAADLSTSILSKTNTLQKMAYTDHDNINKLYGICVLPRELRLVSEYAKHGSIKTLGDRMRVDNDLLLSLIGGFAEGMSFIHLSKLRFHGQLCPECCLVNSRFTLKIAELGYESILHRLVNNQRMRHLNKRYVAPELLTCKGDVPVDTRASGDIYAFGIIVQELLMHDAIPVPVAVIREKNNKQTLPESFKLLFRTCVAYDPETRPSMVIVKQRLQRLLGRRFNNYTQITMSRVVKYAENLEEAVLARTDELKTERAKCESLLRELLPEIVVRALRNGMGVEAELFQCASIYFSSLPGFADWVQSVVPRAVIRLLSDIYAEFDRQIAHYNVRKIETIGDVYMVASGLPFVHTDHAVEICRMAGSLSESFKTAITADYPSFGLELRAGIHSGPCVAGVIGKKVPRYCLYGDTVNTASRMETTGEPGRIHISSNTAALLSHSTQFRCESRGNIQIKGKGAMETFWLS